MDDDPDGPYAFRRKPKCPIPSGIFVIQSSINFRVALINTDMTIDTYVQIQLLNI